MRSVEPGPWPGDREGDVGGAKIPRGARRKRGDYDGERAMSPRTTNSGQTWSSASRFPRSSNPPNQRRSRLEPPLHHRVPMTSRRITDLDLLMVRENVRRLRELGREEALKHERKLKFDRYVEELSRSVANCHMYLDRKPSNI